MQNSLTKERGLNKSAIQLIAVLTMLIDHASVFTTTVPLYFIMKTIGRVAIIVMCYFVAEGYYKTRNIGKYIIRMAIFAAVSLIPYYLYKYWGYIPQNINAIIISVFRSRNVIFTLFIGLCLLTVIKSNYNVIIKIVAIFAALRLAQFSDWGYSAILWIVGFGLFYGDKKKQMIWLVAVLLLRIGINSIEPVKSIIETGELLYWSLYTWLSAFGGFIALLILPFYNGERGNMPKWTFYVFYPTHLLIIVVLMAIIF